MNDPSGYEDELLYMNVAILRSYGFQYVTTVIGAADILRSHHRGKADLTDTQKAKLLDMIIRASRKHEALLKLSINERGDYIDPEESS